MSGAARSSVDARVARGDDISWRRDPCWYHRPILAAWRSVGTCLRGRGLCPPNTRRLQHKKLRLSEPVGCARSVKSLKWCNSASSLVTFQTDRPCFKGALLSFEQVDVLGLNEVWLYPASRLRHADG